MSGASPLLDVRDLWAGYGNRPAVRGVSLSLAAGETVALLGPNGAGKSTLLKAILGLRPADRGRVLIDGRDATGFPAERRARLGIGYVPEGRRLFPGMSVEDNLLVGCRARPAEARLRLEQVYALFPQLPARRVDHAWRLSGGQQQMLAIGRALMGAPRLLLLDEPVLGLAPSLVTTVVGVVQAIAASGPAVLVADAAIGRTLAMSHRYILLVAGAVAAAGPAAHPCQERIERAYLGATLAPDHDGS